MGGRVAVLPRHDHRGVSEAEQGNQASAADCDALLIVSSYLPGPVIERLTRWPAVSGVKSLGGDLVGRYRIRTGDYRIQFSFRYNFMYKLAAPK
jgi:hypothetical protein